MNCTRYFNTCFDNQLCFSLYQLINSANGSCDNRVEDQVKSSAHASCAHATAESKNDWLTKLDDRCDGTTDVRDERNQRQRPVRDYDECFNEPVPRPRATKRQHPRNKVDEPEIKSVRSPRDTKAELETSLQEIMDEKNGPADTDDILDFELGDDAPPVFAPPPIPCEPPPDIPDNELSVLDVGTGSVLGSSPPRDSSSLRAASRQKNSSGRFVPSEPVIQIGTGWTVEGEPEQSEIPSSSRIPQTNQQYTNTRLGPGMTGHPFTPKVFLPPPTLPKPKIGSRRLPSSSRPGSLSSTLTRSRESLNDEEGMGLTPRGYVRATASAINQGELDALGEKINFMEKQLKVSSISMILVVYTFPCLCAPSYRGIVWK